MEGNITLLAVLVFVVAFLYASVGHGGASGYLAIMGLAGVSAVVMRPSALLLNIFVSGIAFIHFYRNGWFKSKLVFPFLILSVPLAFLGAGITLETVWYKRILGICLVIASLRIADLLPERQNNSTIPSFLPALLIGGGIGFVSGILGIGGGILLSPLLLFAGWGNMKETSAASSLFILVNSVAGMAGIMKSHFTFDSMMMLLVIAAAGGGWAGSRWGSERAKNNVMKNILAGVMSLAAIKLILL